MEYTEVNSGLMEIAPGHYLSTEASPEELQLLGILDARRFEPSPEEESVFL